MAPSRDGDFALGELFSVSLGNGAHKPLSQKCRALSLCEQSANGAARPVLYRCLCSTAEHPQRRLPTNQGSPRGKTSSCYQADSEAPGWDVYASKPLKQKVRKGVPPDYRVQLEGDPCPMSPRGELLVSRLQAPPIVGEVIITASERSETRRRAVKSDSKRSFTSAVSAWPKPEMTASFRTTH